jgi:hypothetical protein
MSTQQENDMLLHRVNRFARISIFAGILIAVLSLIYSVLEVRSSPVYHALAGSRYDGVREALAFLTRFAREGAASALYLIGIAVLALLIARIASAGVKYRWVPRLDDAFVKSATTVSTVIIAYALLYALLACFVFANAASSAAREWMTYFRGHSAAQLYSAVGATNMAIRWLLGGLTRFFMFVLGAHIIRILLLMPSGSDVESPKAAEAKA